MGAEEHDLDHLRMAFEAASRARASGNHPFGAALAGPEGEFLLQAQNTVVTEGDITGHAEINLVREAARAYPRDFLAGCTLYASTEPCPMCAGAIYWSGIQRVVYGVSEAELYRQVGEDSLDVLTLSCRAVLSRGRRPVEIIGPLLEEEGRGVHEGFWR